MVLTRRCADIRQSRRIATETIKLDVVSNVRNYANNSYRCVARYKRVPPSIYPKNEDVSWTVELMSSHLIDEEREAVTDSLA